MSTKKATKRALLTSILAICLCLVMLIGSTFAWFTDTASTGVNKIQAGNLHVDIVDTTDNHVSLKNKPLNFLRATAPAEEGGQAATELVAMDAVLWEPGATFYTQGFQIMNTGNLALKYKVVVSGITGDSGLLKVIHFDVVDGMGKEAQVVDFDTTPGTLLPNAEKKALSEKTYYLRGHMDESAGNDYMNMSLTGIAVTVYATQLNSENDSFGPDYDEKATYPAEVWNGGSDADITKDEGTKTISVSSGDVLAALAQKINAGEDYSGYTIKLTGNIDLNGIEWTSIGTASNPFKGIFDGDGYTIKNLKITSGGYIGLFGYLADATVKNVTLVGANVSGTERVGALAGKITGNTTISNCSTDATSAVSGSDSNTGGLIGEAVNGTIKLENLINNAAVTNTKSSTARAGGIIGQVTSGANMTIENCQNNGTVTAANGYAGGIVSAYQGGMLTINNCANSGTLSGAYSGNQVAWITSVKRLTIQTNETVSGSMIGALTGDYKRHFTINDTEYALNGASAQFSFSDAFTNMQQLSSKVADILDFLNYAKTKNDNFKNDYATVTDWWGVFENFAGFGGDGWPQLLEQYNTEKGKNMTQGDFAVTWRTAQMYYYTNS
mgnify:CR=1 FL=1